MFELKQGRLHFKGSLVILRTSAKIPKILQESHDSNTGDHSGFSRHVREPQSQSIGKMKKRIQDYTRAYNVYQKNKYKALTPGGLL